MTVECQKPVTLKPEQREAVRVDSVLNKKELNQVYGQSLKPVEWPEDEIAEEYESGEEISEKEELYRILIGSLVVGSCLSGYEIYKAGKARKKRLHW